MKPETMSMSRSFQRKAAASLLLAASLQLGGVTAFSVVSPICVPGAKRNLCVQPRPSRQSFVQLSVIAKKNDSNISMARQEAINSKVLKRLEGEMEEVARRRKKYEEQLSSVQSKLEETEAELATIETKRKQYLDGGTLGALSAGQIMSETNLRSAVKAIVWRVIAGSVTFVSALKFSGSIKTAFSIVGSDFFSKSFTMFLGERLMNKSQAGRKSGSDDIGRSLAKALIWRLFAICNTLTMSLFFAKDLKIASKIAGSDAIIKTGMMFVYERFWARVEWGKEYEIEYSI